MSNDKASVEIRFRITEDQSRRLKRASRYLGMTMVDIIRPLVHEKLAAIEEDIERQEMRKRARKRSSFMPSIAQDWDPSPIGSPPPSTPPARSAAASTQVNREPATSLSDEDLAQLIASSDNEEEREKRAEVVAKIVERASRSHTDTVMRTKRIDERVNEILSEESLRRENDPHYGTVLPEMKWG